MTSLSPATSAAGPAPDSATRAATNDPRRRYEMSLPRQSSADVALSSDLSSAVSPKHATNPPRTPLVALEKRHPRLQPIFVDGEAHAKHRDFDEQAHDLRQHSRCELTRTIHP